MNRKTKFIHTSYHDDDEDDADVFLLKKILKKKGSISSLNRNKHKIICAQCYCTDSPEWRKGPNGPKELCNACGIKYAKSSQANKPSDS